MQCRDHKDICRDRLTILTELLVCSTGPVDSLPPHDLLPAKVVIDRDNLVADPKITMSRGGGIEIFHPWPVEPFFIRESEDGSSDDPITPTT